jgi:hypothetical protein
MASRCASCQPPKRPPSWQRARVLPRHGWLSGHEVWVHGPPQMRWDVTLVDLEPPTRAGGRWYTTNVPAPPGYPGWRRLLVDADQVELLARDKRDFTPRRPSAAGSPLRRLVR